MIPEIRPIELENVAECVGFGLESFRPVFASFSEHYGHQGQGAGTAINDFAVNRLRDLGMEFAIVATGTDPGHAPARRSYDKAGFTPMSIQPQLLVRRL